MARPVLARSGSAELHRISDSLELIHRSAWRFLIVGLSVVVACDGDPSRTRVRQLTLSQGERIGTEFLGIVGVRELSDGGVLVADRRAQAVYHVGAEASEPQQLGRVGSGPGEYRSVRSLLQLSTDSTAIYDDAASRLVLLDHTSTTDRVLPGPAGRSGLIGSDTLGNYLMGTLFSPPRTQGPSRFRTYIDSILAMRVRRDLTPIDTVARLLVSTGGSYRRSGVQSRIVRFRDPLIPPEPTILFADGWVATAYSDPYHVEWITPAGRRVVGPPLHYEPILATDSALAVAIAPFPSTSEEREQALDDYLDRVSQGYLIRPRHLPPFAGSAAAILATGPDGYLLIRRTVQPGAPNFLYDVIDRTGVRAFTLTATDEMNFAAVVGSGNGTLYLVSTDAIGFQYLHRVPWPQ